MRKDRSAHDEEDEGEEEEEVEEDEDEEAKGEAEEEDGNRIGKEEVDHHAAAAHDTADGDAPKAGSNDDLKCKK